MTQMVAGRVDEEIAILRSWRRVPGGYDETAERVNKSYAETGDIRETMRETRLPFDVVWEGLSYRDEFDFVMAKVIAVWQCMHLHHSKPTRQNECQTPISYIKDYPSEPPLAVTNSRLKSSD